MTALQGLWGLWTESLSPLPNHERIEQKLAMGNSKTGPKYAIQKDGSGWALFMRIDDGPTYSWLGCYPTKAKAEMALRIRLNAKL